MTAVANADVLAALAALPELPSGLDRVKLVAWLQAADELATAKARELELRAEVLGAAFPAIKSGTSSAELGAGYGLKAVLRLNYKLDPPKTDAALGKLRARGEVGALLADRVVKLEPKLVLGEYFKLEKADARLFQPALTITPGQASLELTRPKG